jgi:hypothetical protein
MGSQGYMPRRPGLPGLGGGVLGGSGRGDMRNGPAVAGPLQWAPSRCGYSAGS